MNDALDFSISDELEESDGDDVEVGADADPDDEEAAHEPFIANRAQSRFRAAAISGKFDTLIAAGTISSSKTYGIIALIIDLCLEYQETHFLVVRSRWDNLLDNTIPDFVDILQAFPSEMYSWPNRLTCLFWNGSRIRFRPAREQQDPKFSWLKGMKLDGAFGDEYDGMSMEFISMLQSRVGVNRIRRNPTAQKMPPMAFFACNPNISHPKDDYSRHIHNNASLVAERKYFQLFTVDDNMEFIGPEKLAQWKKTMTPPMYKCFVEGSWDAMSDREQLISFDYMDNCKGLIPAPVDPKGASIKLGYYLGVDPAGYGPDKCCFLIMHGPNLHKLEFFPETKNPQIVAHVKKIMSEYNIPPHHVTIDAIGLGSGVADDLHGEGIFVNAFKGSETAEEAAFYQSDPTDPTSKIEMANYNFTFANKRAQSFWEVMQMMRDGKIGGFNPDVLGWSGDTNLYEVLRQDIASIHYLFKPGTKSILIEDKEAIKTRLKRSPDFADVLVYAVWSYLFDIKKPSLEIFTL